MSSISETRRTPCCISGGLKSEQSALKSVCGEEIIKHPCYSEDASHKFARIHLPVAPVCNISCNYCSRKYDCVNESRPGVTSSIISPDEAVERVLKLKSKIPALTVAGIAGPGDALANAKKSFETFEKIRQKVPEIIFCLSTNGLGLSDHLEEIIRLKIKHVTVTINAVNAEIGAKIYKFVRVNGEKKSGKEGAEFLIERQLVGVKRLSDAGVLCKVNSVILPGINDSHLPEVSKEIKRLGAFVHNMIPYIPCEGSYFYKSGLRRSSVSEIKKLNEMCGADMKMMRHCRQCRADAAGFLHQEEHMEKEDSLAVNF
jgi:nitrogen fixation protein NifB